jgi:hypothetical protein
MNDIIPNVILYQIFSRTTRVVSCFLYPTFQLNPPSLIFNLSPITLPPEVPPRVKLKPCPAIYKDLWTA